MGAAKKVTVGYWHRLLQHWGLCKGPIDAFLEFRAGDRTAWSGTLSGSGTLAIDQEGLWGGKKSEGGISGQLDVQFGEADQPRNDYLVSRLGSTQPAYRGKVSAVWRGGRWGTNPYPKEAAFKVRRILKGWDDDAPWYPETAEIVVDEFRIDYDQNGWKYRVEAPGSTADYSSPDYDDSAWPEGPGGFGSGGPGAGLGVGTYIPTGSAGKGIWIRKTVETRAGIELKIDVYHDDGAWLWWNGTAVALEPTADYFHSVAIVAAGLVKKSNVVVLKVLDAVPGGSTSNIYAGLTIQSNTHLIAMNPAHILYDSLTAQDMQNEPVGMINDASFRAAADKLHAENFGLCTVFDGSEDLEAFQQRICDVIGACLTQSRVDGQYYLDLVRGDYDVASLPVIGSDDIIDCVQEPTGITEVVNQVIVEWYDPQNAEDRATQPVQALGAIQAAGGVIGETRSYPEIPVESLALRAAARDLQARSTPLSKLTLTTNRRPWKLRPGQFFRLQFPEEGIADMVCLVGDIDTGTLTDGRLKIVAVQDVFGMPDTVYVQPESGNVEPEDTIPTASPHQRLIETPYIEMAASLSAADLGAVPAESGAIMAIATVPGNGLDYVLYSAGEGEALDDTGVVGDWCPSALVVETAGYLDTALTMTSGTGLADVDVGTWALWDDEIVRVDSLDPLAGTLQLGRGCADTVPAPHAAGSRIWFCGEFGATDDREYVDGEIVSAKLLTRLPSQQQSVESAPVLTVALDQRQYRPYPPGKLRINGSTYLASAVGDVVLSWEHRDRLLQADKLIDTSLGSIGPESGTTYSARLLRADTLAVLVAQTGLSGATATLSASYSGNVLVELWSVRGGLDSLQKHRHTMAYLPSAMVVSGGASAEPISQGLSYSTSYTVSPGQAPIVWSIGSGALPDGLGLNASTGVLGGTPSVSGSFAFTVVATDAQGFSGSKSQTLTVVADPVITGTPQPFKVGEAYSFSPGTLNIAGPITWSIEVGTLPAGLSLNTGTGVISGTPTSSAAQTVTLTATGSDGSASRSLTLNIWISVYSFDTAPVSGDITALAGSPSVTYDSTNKAISISGSTVQNFVALTAAPVKTGWFVFEADIVFVSDAASRKHLGLFLDTDAAGVNGYRFSTLDNNGWGASKWSGSSETAITNTPVNLSPVTVGGTYTVRIERKADNTFVISVNGSVATTVSADSTYAGVRPGFHVYGSGIRVNEVRST